MTGYWVRHRLFYSVLLSGFVAIITAVLFVFPYFEQQAEAYNLQSVYKNSEIDFIVPEPSFEQVRDLPGTNGIDTVFPYFLTKTQVEVNGRNRITTVLLSNQLQDVEKTMYSSARIIEKAQEEYDNPIAVDWQFYNDTEAKVGDIVSFSIGEDKVEYKISSIYETNSVYDGGAILAPISDEQKELIASRSKNSGYSGMYVISNNYEVCKSFLLTDYRPLGRLKNREKFDSDEQYQIHYDAIMNSGFANEITDFRIKKINTIDAPSMITLWLGIILTLVIAIIYNIVMRKRGCEQVYFTQNIIPKGINVKVYYYISFVVEVLLFIIVYFVSILFRVRFSNTYMQQQLFDWKVLVIPFTFVLVEILMMLTNNSLINKLTKGIMKERNEK